MSKSLLTGILFAVVGILFFVSSFAYDAGPAAFPRIVSLILIFLGLVLGIKNVR